MVVLALAGTLALWSAPQSGWAGEPPEPPLTEACAGAPVSGRRVCGTLNPNTTASVGYYFAYNAGSDCREGERTSPEPEVEGEDIAVSEALYGLAPGAKYSYCLVATNIFGESFGEALSFRTPPPPPAEEEKGEEGEDKEEPTATPAPPAIESPGAFVSPSTVAPEATFDGSQRTRARLARRLRKCGRLLRAKGRINCKKRARAHHE